MEPEITELSQKIQNATSAAEVKKILKDFKLHSEYAGALGDYLQWAWREGHESVGFMSIDFDTLDDSVLAWIQKRAFKTSLTTSKYVKGQLTKYLRSYVQEGKTWTEFSTDIGSLLDKAGLSSKLGHVKTIFRTEAQIASSKGRAVANAAAVKAGVAPMKQILTVPDERHVDGTICEEVHEHNDSFIARASDPIWAEIGQPPFHFNCRSVIVVLPKTVVERENIRPSKWQPKEIPDF